MDNEKLEKYLQTHKDQPAKSWKDDSMHQENSGIEENKRLIKEKNLMPGRDVRLPLLGMTGTIVSVNEKARLPIMVKRSDGEVFPYLPSEVE